MNPILESPEDVLKFWFGSGDEVLKSTTEYIESRMPLWFSGKCQDFDESQRANKSLVHYVASDRVPTEWTTSDGVLARIILLDQFTRCIYRGTAHAFQYDQLTSSLIKQMIELEGYDETNKIYNCMVSYSPIQRFFIGVAAQHAEDQVMQQLGVNIAHMLAIGYDQSIEEYFRILKGYPHEHFQVVKRFGRFPSRNAVLNRESTPEEEEWLASPDCPAWAKTQLKKTYKRTIVMPHRKEIPEGSTCACCWDDIDVSTYVEYKFSESSDWVPSGYCLNCVNHLISTQWQIYVSALAKTTCKAEQRRLLSKGPPINIKDTKALPCPDDGEVYKLWYMSDDQEHSAKLVDSLVGEERQKFWDEQSAFYIPDENEESDPKTGGNLEVADGYATK